MLGNDDPRGMEVYVHIHICVEETECYLDFVMTEVVCECLSLLCSIPGVLSLGFALKLEAVNQEFLGGRSSENHPMVVLRLTQYP